MRRLQMSPDATLTKKKKEDGVKVMLLHACSIHAHLSTSRERTCKALCSHPGHLSGVMLGMS